MISGALGLLVFIAAYLMAICWICSGGLGNDEDE